MMGESVERREEEFIVREEIVQGEAEILGGEIREGESKYKEKVVV